VYHSAFNNVTFLDNHDLSRFYSVINRDFKKWQAGVGMLMTLRGIPCVYYGTEYLLEGYTNPDDLVRQEFNGGWKGDKKNYFTQNNLSQEEKDAYLFYNRLVEFRQTKNLGSLQLKQFVPEDNVYVYFRYDHQSKYMIVVNLGDKTSLDLTRFKEMLNNTSKLIEVFTGDEHSSQETLTWKESQSFTIYEVK
jgi:glycosidase